MINNNNNIPLFSNAYSYAKYHKKTFAALSERTCVAWDQELKTKNENEDKYDKITQCKKYCWWEYLTIRGAWWWELLVEESFLSSKIEEMEMHKTKNDTVK